MVINNRVSFNIVCLSLLLFNVNAYANEPVTTGDSEVNFEQYENTEHQASISKQLHSQLNAIYKKNQLLKSRIAEKDEALNEILSTLKLLNDKIDYRIKSNTVDTTKNEFTMADFNSKGDDLIRKCDEIVDNYYARKSLQEKTYVQNLYATEQGDSQWERDIEDQLQTFIASNNLNESDLFDINCKNSVCKMRVQHQSKLASQEFRNTLRNDADWDIYSSQNSFDRATGDFITSLTLLRNSKEIRKFIWGN